MQEIQSLTPGQAGFDLTLFDHGGAASSEAAVAPSTDAAPQTEQEAKAPGERESGQEKAKEQQEKQAFAQLIQGEYKADFEAALQQELARHTQGVATLEKQLSKQEPILRALMDRYQVDDLDKLERALDADDQWLEKAAEEAGMDVAAYRQYQKAMRENETLRRQQQLEQNRKAADRQYAQWMQQAQSVKGEYPDFDLNKEVQNEEFLALLKSGVQMKTAYEVAHLGDIKSGVAQAAKQQTEKAVTENIRARGARPLEGGGGAGAALQTKTDVANMDKKELDALISRVMRGEKITLT